VAADLGPEGARLVYLGAGDRPMLARHAAAALDGGEGLESALRALEQDLDPLEDVNASPEMRLHLAKVLTRQVLEDAGP